MSDNRAAVDFAVDEGQRLLDKLEPDVRHSDFAGVTCLAFGMLKAIMECPECSTPEERHFRVPCAGYEESWEWITCTHCGAFWHHTESTKAEPAKKQRKSKRARVTADAPMFAEVTQ